MRRLIPTFTFVALPLATAITLAQSASTSSPGSAGSSGSSGLQLDAMDRTADPCNDFYQFACGAWTAKNPIPADRATWGRFDELQERNNDTLRAILEKAAADTPRGGGAVAGTPRGGGAPRVTENDQKKI